MKNAERTVPEIERTIRALWAVVAAQDEERLARFFTPDAQILWPNTAERFDLPGYLRVNCDYPGQWSGRVEMVALDGSWSVAKVWSPEGAAARAVTFYHWKNGKIERMVEYWGDMGPAPEWRQEMKNRAAAGEGCTPLPAAKAVGRCGFCCGVCPSFGPGACAGCDAAHQPGDCFTWDCTVKRGLSFCPQCGNFPCDELLEREKATVLDKDWLRWKRQESLEQAAEKGSEDGDHLPL